MTVWRLEVRDTSGNPHQVIVEGEENSLIVDLNDQLRSLGLDNRPVWTTGSTATSAATVGSLALSHGDILECGAESGESGFGCDAPASGRYLVVVAGPDAGRSFLLTGGRTVIGRSNQADHIIADPLLSGCHAALHIDPDGSVVLTDLQSTNGTLVEGEPLGSEEMPVAPGTCAMPGTFIQVGSSVITILDVTPEELAVLGEHRGAARSLPTRFRQANNPLPTKLKPPSEPPATESTTSPWWRTLTPIVTGIGFAVLTGRWQFLLIIALAPLIFTVDLQRQKKRRRLANEKAAAAHQANVEAFDCLVSDVRSVERARLRSAAIGGGIGTILALVRHQRLWERSPEDADFGSLDLGLASIRSTIDAGDNDAVARRPALWGSPLTTSLPTTGSLSITGPTARCRGVLRSLVVGLTAAHSPAEVKLWLFTDHDAEDDWGFVRWLPHGFNGERTSLVSSTPIDRLALLARLRQLIDTRTDERAGVGDPSHSGPLHVVIVDGVHLLPDADLADLLARGPDVGICGIVADPVSAPEGIRGQLRLGTEADDGSFESRHTPLVTGVRTAELSPQIADQAARNLAGLRPTTGLTKAEGSTHLVELLGIQSIDAADLVDRWEQLSPSTAAVIGEAGDTPLVIDIARHGPHGLVGGMSGSGKTEFLMTLLTSLCLNNHPDDLSIAIVDFKGGVDHALTCRLPHVIGMSTNLHIDQFTRTIQLLDAEQRRRQELLGGIGSDLDAYRVARQRRPELPPLPRLLVIVDEFSELLANDEGRERLQELVRVTRIGRALGVHLLLVTQNFEGQLPPQIEANAGLRVCLRVMKPSHSKVVLDSGIAASITDSDVGRAYARFHGQELIEFQTARVAGRQRDLTSGPPPISVHRVPFGQLSHEPATKDLARAKATKTLAEETDMAATVELLWQAADKTGWTHSAIPWPGDLPTTVPLPELLATHELDDGNSFPIGLEDRPDEQRRVPLTLCDDDQQVLFIGGPTAGVTDVMTTAATSAAILRSPDRLQLHGIDLDGSGLDALRHLPHCGTIATRDEALALRLLRRLNIMVAERRSALVAAGVQTISELPAQDRPVDMLVLVSGTDRLIRRGDDSRSQLVTPLMSLLAETNGTGIRLLLGGLPTLADSRLGVNIERRFVLSLPGDLSPTSFGVPRQLSRDLAVRGRAVDTASKKLCQFASLGDEPRTPTAVVRSVADRLHNRYPTVSRQPLRLATMGWPMPLPSDLTEPPGLGLALPIGFDLESGAMAWVDVEEDGPLIPVAGPSRSGRSTTLCSVAKLAARLGWNIVGVAGSRRSPLRDVDHIHVLEPDQLGQSHDVDAALSGVINDRHDAPLLLLLDDGPRLDPEAFDGSRLVARAKAILVSGPVEFMGGRGGLWQRLPTPRAGLLLSPTSALDGSAVGLNGRLPDEVRADPRPGRGLLAIAGEYRQIQVPTNPQPC